jgi:hypothetical protein
LQYNGFHQLRKKFPVCDILNVEQTDLVKEGAVRQTKSVKVVVIAACCSIVNGLGVQSDKVLCPLFRTFEKGGDA